MRKEFAARILDPKVSLSHHSFTVQHSLLFFKYSVRFLLFSNDQKVLNSPLGVIVLAQVPRRAANLCFRMRSKVLNYKLAFHSNLPASVVDSYRSNTQAIQVKGFRRASKISSNSHSTPDILRISKQVNACRTPILSRRARRLTLQLLHNRRLNHSTIPVCTCN